MDDPFSAWLNGSFGSQLAALGLQPAGHLPTFLSLFGSTVAVVTWMAFAIFNRRRQDEEPPAPPEVLRAAAATGLSVVPTAESVPPIDPESLMPRWRRPSLLEARRTDPVRAPAPERPALTFATSAIEPVRGAERRYVRYAVTTLLDGPDEILANRVGELAEGDEVQVEGRQGAYCEVVSPDGRRGWIHRMTLGDAVPDPDRGGRSFSEPANEAESALAALLAARGMR